MHKYVSRIVIVLLWLVVNQGLKAQSTKGYESGYHENIELKSSITAVHGKTSIGRTNESTTAASVYDTIGSFRDGVAVVGIGKRVVNPFGKVLSDYKYGYIDIQGRLIWPAHYQVVNAFSDSLGLVETNADGTKNYQFINVAGKRVLNRLPYYECTSFSGATAYVETDNVGFWLPPYDDGRDNGNFRQLYDVDGKLIWGNYIDKSGKLLIPAVYDTLAPYVVGRLRPARKGGKWGLLNARAEPVINFHYDDLRLSEGSLIWVKLHKKWGRMDQFGRSVVPFQYDAVQPLTGRNTAVRTAEKWSVIDSTGRLLTVASYDTVFDLSGKRAIVRQGNVYGFIDEKGREIVEPQYTNVSPFVDGHAFAAYHGLIVTLDQNGNWTKVRMARGTLKSSCVAIAILSAVCWMWYRRRKVMYAHQ